MSADEAVGTYPAPEHGWVCFHCGEEFSVKAQGSMDKAIEAAREHFGPYPSFDPACVELARTRPAKLWRRLRTAEMRLAGFGDAESRQELLAFVHQLSDEKDRQRRLIDTLEGRALVAEDIVKRIEATPGGKTLVEEHRERSCTEGYLSEAKA